MYFIIQFYFIKLYNKIHLYKYIFLFLVTVSMQAEMRPALMPLSG